MLYFKFNFVSSQIVDKLFNDSFYNFYPTLSYVKYIFSH